jgi:catechol 2,3-dioxygenase-like lactoylglutathione lyase family enzyme
MPATATVVGLDFIILPSQDLKKAEAFYREVLGLEIDSHWREMGVEFKLADDLTLALVDQAKIGREFAPAKSGSVALKVKDVDSAVAHLEAKGVEFHDVIDSGVCKMAFFSDPDGNSLMLHHRYAP